MGRTLKTLNKNKIRGNFEKNHFIINSEDMHIKIELNKLGKKRGCW